ncbi:hypothetical protein SLE2022_080160 [Rubroshorea leprosula]
MEEVYGKLKLLMWNCLAIWANSSVLNNLSLCWTSKDIKVFLIQKAMKKLWLVKSFIFLKLLISCFDGVLSLSLFPFFFSLSESDMQRNEAKLSAVGTSASLIGVDVINALINLLKAFDQSFAREGKNVPILSTSVAYGVYIAVSSNLG